MKVRGIAAEEKKNTPSEKAKSWLAKFAADQAACLSLVAKSKSPIGGMKDSLRNEYHKIFADVAAKMEEACKDVQTFLADQSSDSETIFAKATEVVEEFKREKRAFDRCMESYEKRQDNGDKDSGAPQKKSRKKAAA